MSKVKILVAPPPSPVQHPHHWSRQLEQLHHLSAVLRSEEAPDTLQAGAAASVGSPDGRSRCVQPLGIQCCWRTVHSRKNSSCDLINLSPPAGCSPVLHSPLGAVGQVETQRGAPSLPCLHCRWLLTDNIARFAAASQPLPLLFSFCLHGLSLVSFHTQSKTFPVVERTF